MASNDTYTLNCICDRDFYDTHDYLRVIIEQCTEYLF